MAKKRLFIEQLEERQSTSPLFVTPVDPSLIMTTMMVGEEGGPIHPPITTQAIGEEGGITMAFGEEGMHFTSMLYGEEGGHFIPLG
ncbi:hypothetical protein [Kyrpidia tusciae]|uniref:Uncharacterized protein n=1 Tax=Kyrpidia tusciae (strain DSM 2912 / NBRC 15312 / T2) TaxID=562970 RepID=D5WQY8_KYRT2|nr:hypothetical protein [Kyrpidia tusciae]ADG06747.1 hypothetical protein Btus_2057 [Kyrpidia tusciae DSM 2912]